MKQASTTSIFAHDSIPSACWSGWHMEEINEILTERVNDEDQIPREERVKRQSLIQEQRISDRGEASFVTDVSLLL